MELKKPLHAALKALARWRDDGDVALAVLHAQAMSANDPGWSHCSAVLLRGVARAVSACADELERADQEPEALGEVARNLALSAQVLAGLAAGLRRSAKAAEAAHVEAALVDEFPTDHSPNDPAINTDRFLLTVINQYW